MNTSIRTALVLASVLLLGVWLAHSYAAPARTVPAHKFAVAKTDAEWRRILTPPQYNILRQQGTEAPFSGQYSETRETGTYVCAACGQPLFSSRAKYDSGTGWPSFWVPVAPGSVLTQTDSTFGIIRDEVVCSRCGGHLGHVFDDGPAPTGLRYCMNSAALKLIRK